MDMKRIDELNSQEAEAFAEQESRLFIKYERGNNKE